MYEGKARREEVLAETPAAPWQLVRRFCANRPFDDGWRNLLVWGDNLLALRELLADQRGPDRLGTRGKIKLIYIDPPFATRQDFMKDKEKAYQDKVLGSQFIEFLRRRLVLLREVLADDGSIYVHLDILVVEIKQDGDDSNRNRAKHRDGTQHFDTLNRRLTEAGELWRYHFYFLSPEDYPSFFDRVREKTFAGRKSGLMQSLQAELG